MTYFLTPHPGLSEFLSARLGGTEVRPMVDATACRRYAEAARERLSKRVARENSQ